MKKCFTCLAVLLAASIAFSQQAPKAQSEAPTGDVQNYASYGIALFPPAPNSEVVLPFLTAENKIVFFPLSTVQQAVKENRVLGRPISYGEVVSLIGQFQIENDKLKQENERLWAVVGKSSPQTVIVQSPSAAEQAAADAQRAALAHAEAQRLQEQRREAILRFLMGQQTQRVNMNVNVTDCTRFPALCVNH